MTREALQAIAQLPAMVNWRRNRFKMPVMSLVTAEIPQLWAASFTVSVRRVLVEEFRLQWGENSRKQPKAGNQRA